MVKNVQATLNERDDTLNYVNWRRAMNSTKGQFASVQNEVERLYLEFHQSAGIYDDSIDILATKQRIFEVGHQILELAGTVASWPAIDAIETF